MTQQATAEVSPLHIRMNGTGDNFAVRNLTGQAANKIISVYGTGYKTIFHMGTGNICSKPTCMTFSGNKYFIQIHIVNIGSVAQGTK